MNKLSFIALALIASTVSADKPVALRRLNTVAPVAVPVAVVTPVATPTTASSGSSKNSKRQLVHYSTPYES
eukprot:CAMPEP_0113625370 /NCGR_PEP_ID=MMETSP0017_2-20120614/13105_1 /TAXON_ID=2856 /ORGANISM="Cylindrotheca closterium" /LENGTH=70 /DNA_ID=CAMNT_0000535483 /DNA_START=74 /DNA_END=286 /DNA_ORIENTATION=- /assembly_acc=CAM_ASM_000147